MSQGRTGNNIGEKGGAVRERENTSGISGQRAAVCLGERDGRDWRCIPWPCTTIAVSSTLSSTILLLFRPNHVMTVFLRYLWLEGRPSEPSWLGSWVPSTKISKLFQPLFLPELWFSFFSSSPSTFLFLLRSLSFYPRATHAIRVHPPTLLRTPLAPFAPYTSPPPVPLATIIPNPSKTLSCTLEFSFCPSRRHSSEESSPPTRPPTTVRRATGGPLTP
jgi:hypothetical protein